MINLGIRVIVGTPPTTILDMTQISQEHGEDYPSHILQGMFHPSFYGRGPITHLDHIKIITYVNI